MQHEIKLISIGVSDSEIVNNFLKAAGKSLDSFRYFSKRDITILKNHICTYILLENNEPIGYGHLDKDDEIIWLGIAVAERAIGKGYGKRILKALIAKAKEVKIKAIDLSVDNNNLSAINLYEKHGFKLIRKEALINYYRLNTAE